MLAVKVTGPSSIEAVKVPCPWTVMESAMTYERVTAGMTVNVMVCE